MDLNKKIIAVFSKDAQVDESQKVAGLAQKHMRPRGATDQITVFSLFKQRAYKITPPNTSPTILIQIIECKIVLLISSYWLGQHALAISNFKHYYIYHAKLLTDKRNHINATRRFCSQVKCYMANSRVCPRGTHWTIFKGMGQFFNSNDPKYQLFQFR